MGTTLNLVLALAQIASIAFNLWAGWRAGKQKGCPAQLKLKASDYMALPALHDYRSNRTR